jgi:hypothetical protein
MSDKETMSNWGSDEKIAAIFYYYLSLGNDSAEEKVARFSELFDVKKSVEGYLNTMGLLDQGETVPDDDDEVDRFLRKKLPKTEVLEHFCIAFDKFAEVKDEVIRMCEETLAGFADEERYELIVDEIDRLRGVAAHSGLWNDFPLWWQTLTNSGTLDLNVREYLWAFVFASVEKGELSDAQRKFLRHFCRVVGLDKDVLNAMEGVAKQFVTIGKNRKDAKTGTRPYAEVVAELAALDTDEAVAHQTLSTLLGLDSGNAGEESDGDSTESSDEKIYEPWADEDSSVIEKLAGATMNVLDGIADGLSEFAGKL